MLFGPSRRRLDTHTRLFHVVRGPPRDPHQSPTTVRSDRIIDPYCLFPSAVPATFCTARQTSGSAATFSYLWPNARSPMVKADLEKESLRDCL
eukprot:7090150-Prymnesium_polylepis.1